MKPLNKILDNSRAVIILAPLILFSPLFLTGRALFWGTSATQFVPWWDFAWRSILSGQFPFWNPLVGMGAPLAANYQTALFYPITWIYFIFYLLGGVKWMAWAISLVVCGHIILSGLGTAKLLKELKISHFGQTIGGLAFSLSGYLVARAGFLSINAAAAWIPWLLLYLYRLANKKSGVAFKLTAVLSMLLLAGHAQTAWHALLLGGIWTIYWAIYLGKPDQKITNLGKTLAGFLGAGFLALGITAIQVFPTAEYLMFSQRASEYGYERAMTYSFWPWRFLTFIAPDLFGNPATGSYWGYGNYWEDAVYIGLLPILLALGFVARSAWTKIRRSQSGKASYQDASLFLGVLVLGSFLLALGDNTSIFPFIYKIVPGVDLFQAPTRYSIIGEISLALLAGFGAHELLKPVGRRLYFTRLAVAGSVSVVIGAVVAGIYLEGNELTFLYAVGRAGVIGMLAAILFLSMPAGTDQWKTKLWQFLVVGLVSLDLITAGWGLNPGIETGFYDHNVNQTHGGRIWMPESVEYNLKFNRFFTFESFNPGVNWDDMHDVYLPNLPMLQGLESVNNFDPLVPGFYQDWMASINVNAPDQQILEMMNVSAIVEDNSLGDINLKSMDYRIQPVRVAGCADVQNPASGTPQLILENDTNLIENIIIFSDNQEPCSHNVKGEAEILEEKNGYLLISIDLDQDGWIFWSQTWYPGWEYRLDGGVRNPTFRVNYLFQGAPVPSNTEQVEFIYRPISLIWGGIVSGFSLLLAAAIVLVSKRRAPKS